MKKRKILRLACRVMKLEKKIRKLKRTISVMKAEMRIVELGAAAVRKERDQELAKKAKG